MANKTLSLPEDVLVNMLKALPESVLVDVFWKTLPKSDISPLTQEEIDEISGGLDEACELGIRLAERLLDSGGREILAAIVREA